MPDQKFIVGKVPTINIEKCAGNITIQGSSVEEIVITGDGRAKVTENLDSGDHQLTLQSDSACKVYVPHMSKIRVSQASGRLSIQECLSVSIQQIAGDSVSF